MEGSKEGAVEGTKTRCATVMIRVPYDLRDEIKKRTDSISKLEVTDVLKVAWHVNIVKRNEKIT